jgi:hypothetical protein
VAKLKDHNFAMTNDSHPSVHQFTRTFRPTTVVGQSRSMDTLLRRSDDLHNIYYSLSQK